MVFFILYLAMEFVTYEYAFSCGVLRTVEYSSMVIKFSRTVRMEYSASDTEGMIAAMEDDDNDNTSAEWIAHTDSIHQMEK